MSTFLRHSIACLAAAIVLSGGAVFSSTAFAEGANNLTGSYDLLDDNEFSADSENGNGYGNGDRRPCAGCAGTYVHNGPLAYNPADDKNPPGQLPDASDSNDGYECDYANHGIARMNPAHSGCGPDDSLS